MKYIRMILSMVLLVTYILVPAGCGKENKSNNKVPTLTEEESTGEIQRHNAEDLVVLTAVDTKASQISVRGVGSSGKIYVLNYSGSTSIKNKYGREILISQLELGEVLKVYYVAGTQKLIAMEESPEVWENDSVTKWDMDYEASIMSIGGENYQYDKNTFILSGKKTISINAISGVDTLVVRGKDKHIYSIVVKTGHGYIKLTDTANMVGGIVDVGGKIVTVITEDMVITAPEGEHVLTASKNGKGGSTNVTVARNEEVFVSLSGFQGEVEKNGALNLKIYPQNIKYNVFVDGNEVDNSHVLDLSYGEHTLLITSDTYEDYREKIVINSIYTNKAVRLDGTEETSEKATSGEKESTSKRPSEGETTSLAPGQDNLVTVNKPEGASLYIDGWFKGIIPLTMEKQPGKHTAVLRQTGYKSVSYELEFSEDRANVKISFPAMEKSE